MLDAYEVQKHRLARDFIFVSLPVLIPETFRGLPELRWNSYVKLPSRNPSGNLPDASGTASKLKSVSFTSRKASGNLPEASGIAVLGFCQVLGSPTIEVLGSKSKKY